MTFIPKDQREPSGDSRRTEFVSELRLRLSQKTGKYTAPTQRTHLASAVNRTIVGSNSIGGFSS